MTIMKHSLRSFAASLLATATLLLAVPSHIAFAQPACVNGVYMATDTSADAMDVDDDDDGLIEICTLTGLDAIRHNFAGTSYKATEEATGVRCGELSDTDCEGYELTRNLDFADTGESDHDAALTADGAGGGPGWVPIGNFGTGITCVFEGNGHVIENLYVKSSGYGGLFSSVSAGRGSQEFGLDGGGHERDWSSSCRGFGRREHGVGDQLLFNWGCENDWLLWRHRRAFR